MQFDFSQITHTWQAIGGKDRVYTVEVIPTGYFRANGNNNHRICRTHFEAIQCCETWEQQCKDEDASIWQESSK